MKSKKNQRLLALILSMVLMLSASISAMAEGDVQTETSGTEVTQNQTEGQDPENEASAASYSAEIPEAEEQETLAEQGTEETIETELTGEETTPVETNETVQPESTQNEEQQAPETVTENGQTTEETVEPQTVEETVTEEPEEAVSESAELKQEFTDENGNVTQTVTAYVPEGAFQATADQISMEVTLLNTDDENYIKGMMEELLPENYYLDGYVLYQIDFKVNGEITQPAKAITITMAGNELAVEDTQKAHVFYYDPEDPEVEDDKDQLVEVTQKDQLIKSLEESGQSTENIDDYDYSEITVNEGNADTITVKGWDSTIYGCYVEKEAATELTYEDDSVTVTVSADQAGIIPEGAELSVTPITKTEITDDMSKEEKAQAKEINAQYDFTEEKLQKDSEENDTTMEGFLAYDICFLVDGEEVEPSGDVRVVMDFKEAAVPEDVPEDAVVTVKHLKEDGTAEDGIVVEDMTEVANVEIVEQTKIEKVELKTDSFSVFTINWVDDGSLQVQVVDSSGKSVGKEGSYDFKTSDYGTAKWRDIPVNTIADKIKSECNIQDLDFNKAVYVKEDGEFTFSANRVYALYKDSNGFKYANRSNYDGTKGWSSVGNGTIYFIFGDDPELTTTPVDKVVSTKDTISINLFDYQVGTDGDESAGWDSNSGINHDHALKFVDDKGEDNHTININQEGTSGKINSNMVMSKLTNGFPTLQNRNGGDGKSLSYLFDNSSSNFKSVYSNLDNLFKIDEDGYHVFNSDENYAYLPYDENKGFSSNFSVVNINGQESVGFYPFSQPDYDTLANIKNPSEKAVLGYTGVNHYYGMTIETSFIQPKGGQITGKNENAQNMIFEFSGDDDVWVFIDDVLVLDLGGIHGKVSGTINFATGAVTRTDINGGNASGTTIKEAFEAANVEGDFKAETNTFSDYSTHTIKFFYLERGNIDSNCMIRFNFPTIPTDSVSVAKEVTDENGTGIDYADNIDFEFNINVGGDNYSSQSYTLWENGCQVTDDEGNPVTGTTDKNGNFTLKHSQMAVFSELSADTKYQVTELGAYLNGYTVYIDGTEHQVNPDTSGGVSVLSAKTDILTVGEDQSVVFRNEIEDRANLSIKKELGTGEVATSQLFQIRVTIQGEIYEGTYSIGNITGLIAKDGIITLGVDETATITGLPYGVKVEIEEVLNEDSNYLPTYEMNGDVHSIIEPKVDEMGNPILDNDGNPVSEISSISGIIYPDESGVDPCEVNAIVTNHKNKIDIPVEKKWKGDPQFTQNWNYVTVQLYQNGKKYESPVQIKKDEGWKYTFHNLPYSYLDSESKTYIPYEYTIEELDIESDPIYEDWVVEITGSAEEGFTITNIFVPHWFIQKVSSTNSSSPLGGAEFTLTKKGETIPSYYGQSYKEIDGYIVWWDSREDIGHLEKRAKYIPDGTYIFEETKAPDGYVKNNVTWEITIQDLEFLTITDSSGNSICPVNTRTRGLVQMTIFQYKNTPCYELPSAGGPGIFLYMIGGTLLLMVGSLMIYINRSKGGAEKTRK